MMYGNDIAGIIAKYERDLNNTSFYVGRNIPEKKGRNAVQEYGDNGIETVYALYDGTIFGSAKEGIMFTERSLFYHYLFSKWVVDYADIDRLEIGKGNTDHPDSKSDILYIITRRGEFKLEISTLDKRILRAMLEEICGLRYSRRDDGYNWRDDPRHDQRYDDNRRYDDDHRHDGYHRYDDDHRHDGYHRYDDDHRHDGYRRYDDDHRHDDNRRYDDRYDDRNHRR